MTDQPANTTATTKAIPTMLYLASFLFVTGIYIIILAFVVDTYINPIVDSDVKNACAAVVWAVGFGFIVLMACICLIKFVHTATQEA